MGWLLLKPISHFLGPKIPEATLLQSLITLTRSVEFARYVWGVEVMVRVMVRVKVRGGDSRLGLESQD